MKTTPLWTLSAEWWKTRAGRNSWRRQFSARAEGFSMILHAFSIRDTDALWAKSTGFSRMRPEKHEAAFR